MTFQQIMDSLVEIREIHVDGRISDGNGWSHRESDPVLRGVAVALKLDRLINKVFNAIAEESSPKAEVESKAEVEPVS